MLLKTRVVCLRNITNTFLEISEPQIALQTVCCDVICFSAATEIRFLSLKKMKNEPFKTYWFSVVVLLLCVRRLEAEIQAGVIRGSAKDTNQ